MKPPDKKKGPGANGAYKTNLAGSLTSFVSLLPREWRKVKREWVKDATWYRTEFVETKNPHALRGYLRAIVNVVHVEAGRFEAAHFPLKEGRETGR